MKTVQINVGMNNNPMNEEQIINYFASLQGYDLMAYYFKDKTFEGEVEPTFCAILEYKYARQSKVLTDFENICSLMNQESIAISTDFMEILAFNTSYSGKGYLFDKELFEYVRVFEDKKPLPTMEQIFEEMDSVLDRDLTVIAQEIRDDWGAKVNYCAKSYLDAMATLKTVDDNYYLDSAKSIILYFLSNASSWRGETAKRIKTELKTLIK